MPVDHPNIYYRFQQRTIQQEGGWCTGMSLYLQNELANTGRITALRAYDIVERRLKSATSDTRFLWSNLQQAAGFSYRAPAARFPLTMGEPVRVITLVANVGYFTSFALLSPGSVFSWMIGQANHACLMLPGDDGLMFFEPNWGLGYWSRLACPATEGECYRLLNSIISWGYQKVGESHRTGYVIGLFTHSVRSYSRALETATLEMV